MPYLRLWRYQVTPGHEVPFEAAYGPHGDWAQLFGRAEGYLGTELLHAVAPTTHYYTIDRWRTEADWHRFLAAHRPAYEALDRRLAPLCTEDIEIASFSTADPAARG